MSESLFLIAVEVKQLGIGAVQARCALAFNRFATAARNASVDVPFVMKTSAFAPGGASGSPESIMIGTFGRSRFISAVTSSLRDLAGGCR